MNFSNNESAEEMEIIRSLLPTALGAQVSIDRSTGLVIVTAINENELDMLGDTLCSIVLNIVDALSQSEEKEVNENYYLPNDNTTLGAVMRDTEEMYVAEANLSFGIRSDEHVHGADLFIHLGALLREVGHTGRIVGVKDMRFYKAITKQPIVVLSLHKEMPVSEGLLVSGKLQTTENTTWNFGYYEGDESIETTAGRYRHVQHFSNIDRNLVDKQKQVHTYVLPELNEELLNEIAIDSAGGLATSVLLGYLNEGILELRHAEFFDEELSGSMLVAGYNSLQFDDPTLAFIQKGASMEFIVDTENPKMTKTAVLFPVSFCFKNIEGNIRAHGEMTLAVLR